MISLQRKEASSSSATGKVVTYMLVHCENMSQASLASMGWLTAHRKCVRLRMNPMLSKKWCLILIKSFSIFKHRVDSCKTVSMNTSQTPVSRHQSFSKHSYQRCRFV